MTAAELNAAARDCLATSISEGRLPAKPSPTTIVQLADVLVAAGVSVPPAALDRMVSNAAAAKRQRGRRAPRRAGV
jgi:hypothetical protein